jgi:hypothetical protein
MVCNSCGRFRGWLGNQAITFINETRARFGAPEIITIRSFPRTPSGAGGEDIEERRRKVGPEMDMRSYSAQYFIRLEDVSEGPLEKTIAKVVPGSFDKPEACFDDGSKLSLNKTSVLALSKAFGWESADWIGKPVEIYEGSVVFKGTAQPGVLVRPVVTSPSSASTPRKDDLDDEIAF